MSGILYLCATPIGNLEDITLRVLRTLQEVDLIAAEDTRNSIKLLNHYKITTPMTSYHEHNKIEKGRLLIERMQNGENIALITDAGTPAISDPGEELVAMAYENNITVTSLPGACACVTALTISGLPTRRFLFEAFLPTDKNKRKVILASLAEETRTMILYEAPHRLAKTLLELMTVFEESRRISVCRELTKKHETVFSTTIREAYNYYSEQAARGECIILIEGQTLLQQKEKEQDKWLAMPLEEHLKSYMDHGMDKKEAMKAVAADRGISKRDVYQAMLQYEKEQP